MRQIDVRGILGRDPVREDCGEYEQRHQDNSHRRQWIVASDARERDG